MLTFSRIFASQKIYICDTLLLCIKSHSKCSGVCLASPPDQHSARRTEHVVSALLGHVLRGARTLPKTSGDATCADRQAGDVLDCRTVHSASYAVHNVSHNVHSDGARHKLLCALCWSGSLSLTTHLAVDFLPPHISCADCDIYSRFRFAKRPHKKGGKKDICVSRAKFWPISFFFC